MIGEDEDYRRRLERHYAMWRLMGAAALIARQQVDEEH
jgi:hypothetical protein